MTRVILATSSPYRIEAFRFLGIDFEAEASNIDESQADRVDPKKLVRTLSKLKSEAVAKKYPDAVVIGMDSVGYFNGQILEKPKSREEAFRRLKLLSGNNLQFYTGIHIINTALGKSVSKVVKTEVFMRSLSDKEINRYLDEDPYYDTHALGYNPLRHSSSAFVQRIEGSYNNLIRGIPLEIIGKMLSEVGYIE